MADLFNIQGRVVFPNAETLLISPFKEIWERDTDPDKRNAIEEFAYMEFMVSMRKSNPFAGYDQKDKHRVIVESVINIPDWSPDELVMQGLEKLHEFNKEASVTYTYYMALKTGAEKLKNFFKTVDLNERTEKGMPLYKPSEVTRAISEGEKNLTTLNNIKKKVEEELFESSRVRSDKVVSYFADPDSLKD